MTIVPEAMTRHAPWTAANFSWECDAIANLVTRFVDLGGFVVEIDGLSGGMVGRGRGGLPQRHLALAPIDYVCAIISAGLDFEGDFARSLAGECVVGGFDFDYERSIDVFDPRFNSRRARRIRVRGLDSHLKSLPQPSFVIIGGYGVNSDMLRSGRGTIAEHLPFIAVRPTSSEDLDAFSAALRELEPSYEWICRPSRALIDGTGAASHPYFLAVPATRRERFGELLGSDRGQRHPLRTRSGSPSASIRISPDSVIASRGFHAVESLGDSKWRWGGALPRLSALIEVPAPGLYEIRVEFANALPGALESIDGIMVNGALLTDDDRDPQDLFFTVTSRVARPLLLEINCPHRQSTPSDPRQLSVALGDIRLRRRQL